MLKYTFFLYLILNSFAFGTSLSNPLGLKEGGWGEHYNIPRVAAPALVISGLILGNDSRLGKTAWKSIDSMLIGGLITEAGKATFGRVRPINSPLYDDQWFQPGNKSFPSGHVSCMTSIVTPFIFEYSNEEPLINLLWLVPMHQVIGRVKDKKHYISDVIAGFAVGVFSGWIASDLETPLTLSWKESGFYAGVDFNF